jgi:programmed cell death protein 5
VKAFILGFIILVQGKLTGNSKLEHSPRRPTTTIHQQTSQIPKRKHRPNPTTNMGSIRQNRQPRRKTTSKPRLVVHTQRIYTAQSLRSRTHRLRKAQSRLRWKKRLLSHAKPSSKSRRKQHPQSPATTRICRPSPNRQIPRKKNDSQRTQTPPRSSRRLNQRTCQNHSRAQEVPRRIRMSDQELDAIRRKKLLAMQQKNADEQKQSQSEQYEAQKQALLKQILSPEARQRLTNLKMIKPEFTDQIELQLIQLAQSDKLPIPLSDAQLKQILIQLQTRKREITIRRV